MSTPAACLPLVYTPAETSDLELASEVYDATAILTMGESGIAEHVAADLRRRREEAVRELARRWGSS